jgi:hypothetical protein
MIVMAGLVPAIHVLAAKKVVDARDKPGHDEREVSERAMNGTRG